MIFKNETMTWNWPGWSSSNCQAQDLYNYLHQYDNRFTLDGANTSVDFDGKFKIKIMPDYGTYRPHWAIQGSDPNSTVYDTQPSTPNRGYWFETGCKPLRVIFLDSEDFIYLIAWPNDESLTSGNNIGFSYIKTTDGKHYAQTLNPGTQTIDGRPYYNVTEGDQAGFTLSPFINFAAPATEIYTTDKCLLMSSGESSTNELLKSCSTMTYNQVITINGKNYYTAGNHTLVPLDS